MGVFATLTFCFRGASAFSNEITVREELKRTAAELFFGGNFARLDTLLDGFLRDEARTPSGLWKLTLLDGFLAAAFGGCKRDQACWREVETRIDYWIKVAPNSPNAHFAYANILLIHGWSYRGGGYANTVEPEDWVLFHDYLNRSRSYLESHQDLLGNDPRWHETMIDLAGAQQWPKDEFERLVNDAIAIHPQYYSIYFAAIKYYLPKWGGSAHGLENYIVRLLQKIPDREKDALYARMYWYANQTQFNDLLFVYSRADWPKMARGLNDVVTQYPDPWNYNSFLKFSCLKGDASVAAPLVRAVGDKPDPEAWGSTLTYDNCMQWLHEQTNK